MTNTATTAVEMMSAAELLMLSIESRFGKMVSALDRVAGATTAGADNITALTEQVNRLADAFEQMAGTLACVTEAVESDEDGLTRCFVRTRNDNHAWLLASRDERNTED
jgi:ABC-type transporter Mla subunit MlaD